MDVAETVVLELAHDKRGRIDLTFGEWQDHIIEIAFRDRVHRASGVIAFNGLNGTSIVRPRRPYSGALADTSECQRYFGAVLATFARSYTFGWSPTPDQMPH